MNSKVTFAQLQGLLEKLGFRGTTHPTHLTFQHTASDTVFLFRTYRATDAVTPANLAVVRRMLDERGLMPADRFEKTWSKSPPPQPSRGARATR